MNGRNRLKTCSGLNHCVAVAESVSVSEAPMWTWIELSSRFNGIYSNTKKAHRQLSKYQRVRARRLQLNQAQVNDFYGDSKCMNEFGRKQWQKTHSLGQRWLCFAGPNWVIVCLCVMTQLNATPHGPRAARVDRVDRVDRGAVEGPLIMISGYYVLAHKTSAYQRGSLYVWVCVCVYLSFSYDQLGDSFCANWTAGKMTSNSPLRPLQHVSSPIEYGQFSYWKQSLRIMQMEANVV